MYPAERLGKSPRRFRPVISKLTRTLRRTVPSLRKDRGADEGASLLDYLGMQVTPLFENADASSEHRESWLEVGMGIEVLERGERVYPRQ